MHTIRSQELRNIFFNMYNLGCKIKEISNYLNIHISTLYRWIKEGYIRKERTSRILRLEKYKEDIIKYIENNNTCTLQDIKDYLNTDLCISTIYNFLNHLNISFKKGCKIYTEADPIKTEKFMT
jgi:excisionase family DNA binding protein